MLYSDLKKFIEQNNIDYKLFTNKESYETIDIVDGRMQYVTRDMIVGYDIVMSNISGKKGQSEWQRVVYHFSGEELKDNTDGRFVERYSLLSGRVYTGVREMLRIEDMIESRMK